MGTGYVLQSRGYADRRVGYKAVAMPSGVWAEPSEESLGESTRRVDSFASVTEFLGRRLEVRLT